MAAFPASIWECEKLQMIRKPYRYVLSVLLLPFILVLLLTSLRSYFQYQLWMYMAPYRSLMNTHADEKRVIDELGTPIAVITDYAELRHWTARFAPRRAIDFASGNKVFIYWADPWNDAEGHVVYILFGNRGIVKRVVFGG